MGSAMTGAGGVTDGKYCRGGIPGGTGALTVPEPDEAGDVARSGGVTRGGVATGASVKISVLADDNPTESLTDGSSGASFETQKRPWQRGQLA
jgi:hypothetical protein